MPWEPAESAAKNEAGQYVGLIGGEWVPVQGAAKDASGKFMVLRDQGTPPARSQTPPPAKFTPSGEQDQLGWSSPEVIAAQPALRVARGAASPFIGGAQLLAHLAGGGKDLDATIKQGEDLTREGAGLEKGDMDPYEVAGSIASPFFLKGASLIKPGERLLTRALQGVGFGGAGGLTAPVTDGGDKFAEEKAQQTGVGAAIGGVIPGAAAVGSKVANTVYHGLIEPWANPAAIKGRAYLEAAGDKTKEIIDLLTRNRQIVPGSAPTAGEAAAPAGRAEFSALQESAGKVKPSDYVAREDAQNAARVESLKDWAGNPAKRAEAAAARTARSQPHYEAATGVTPKNESPLFIFKDGRVESGKGMDAHGNLLQDLGLDNDPEIVAKTGRFYVSSDKDSIKIIAGKDLYSKADALEAAKNYVERNTPSKPVTLHFDAETIPVYAPSKGQSAPTAGLNPLMERPSSSAVLKRAERLMQEKDKTFEPLFPSGLPRNLSGEEAQSLKLAFDDMITAYPKSAMDSKELDAIKATRGEYVKWMEKAFPELGTGRKLYKMTSQPINQMDVGEELVGKLTPALREDAKQRGAVFAGAVRDSASTIKKATGEPRFQELKDVLTGRQLQSVHNVQDDLARSDRHLQLAREGASAGPAADLLATQNLQNQTGGSLPNMLHRGVMLANAVIARMEGKVNKKLASEMAAEMLNPPGVAQSLAEAQAREARNKMLAEAIYKYQRPVIGGVANQVQTGE